MAHIWQRRSEMPDAIRRAVVRGAGLAAALVVALCATAACESTGARVGPTPEGEGVARGRGGGPPTDTGAAASVEELREQLIRELAPRVFDPRVLGAVRAVPRDRFADAPPASAWSDRALTTARGAVVPPPSTLAGVVRALELHGHERVLVVGAGSGYEIAVLARLAGAVEVIEPRLARAIEARRRLDDLGVDAVVRVGDVQSAPPELASVDRVVVLTAVRSIPDPLLEAARSGGIVVATIGAERGPRRLLRARRIGSLVLPEDLGAID